MNVAVPTLSTRSGFLRQAAVGAVGTVMVLLAIVASSAPSGAQTTASITVRTAPLSAGDVPLLDDSASFTANRQAIQDAIAPGGGGLDGRILALPADITGDGTITVSVTVDDILFDDLTRSVALPATVNLQGRDVDILLLAQWPDDSSFIPAVSVGLHTGTIDLGAWGLELPATPPILPDTWLALSSSLHDLTPFTAIDPSINPAPPAPLLAFFPVGFTLADGPATTWRSTMILDSAIGVTATEALGYVGQGGLGQATEATLNGQVSATAEILNGDLSGTDIHLDASLPPAPNAAIGGWLQATGPWAITLDHTVGTEPSPVSLGITGQIGAAAGSPLDGKIPPVNVVGALDYTNPGEISGSLTGAFDDGVDTDCNDLESDNTTREFPVGATSCWSNAMDYDWLDLTNAVVGTTFQVTTDDQGVTTSGATVTMDATFDPDGPDPTPGSPNFQPLDIGITFGFVPGTITTEVVVSRPNGDPMSMADVASLFSQQGTAGASFPGQDLLGLRDVTFFAEVGLNADPALANATFTLTARTTVLDDPAVDDDGVEVDVLVGLTKTGVPGQPGSEEPLILLGIRTTDITLSTLFGGTVGNIEGTGLGELTMPGVDYSIAFPLSAVVLPDPMTVTAEDLSQAARDFYYQDVGLLHLEAGVSIRGTADLTSLGPDFADAVGYPADGNTAAPPLTVDYTGSIAGTFDWGNGAGASVDLTSIDLTGQVNNTLLLTPDWMPAVTASAPFIHLGYSDAAGYIAELRTTLNTDIDGNDAVDGTATGEDIAVAVGVTYDDDADTLGFSSVGYIGRQWAGSGLVGDGEWPQPFGTDLTVLDATLAFSFTNAPPAAQATISGRVPVGTSATLGLTATVTSAPSADFRLELADGETPIPLADIVELAAKQIDPTIDVHADLDGLAISNATVAMHLGAVPTFLLEGTTIYRDVATSVLLTVDAAADVMVGLRLRPTAENTLTLGDLDDRFVADPFGSFGLPDLTLVVATTPVQSTSAALDPAAYRFFAEVHGCPIEGQSPDSPAVPCDFDLDIDQGVTILSSVGLPDDFRPAQSSLGIADDARVLLKGFVPLFGADATAEPRFEGFLPAFTPPNSPQWFKQAQLSFYITPTSFGLTGAMTVWMDDGDGVEQTGEILTFDLTGAIDLSATPPSLTIAGGLTSATGWQQPFGVEWLTVNTLRLELELNGSVTIGFRGAFKVDTKDLDVSMLVRLDAGVPTLLGIRGASLEGFTLTELATFQITVANAAVNGTPVDISQLTSAVPTLAIKGVEFSYAAVERRSLCLAQGIIFAGTAFINPAAGAAGQPQSACNGQVPPDRPPAAGVCQPTQGCLASMRVKILPSGIRGQGSLPTLNIGNDDLSALRITNALVDLVANPSERYLEVSGNAVIPGPGPDFVTGQMRLRIDPTGRSFTGDFKVFGAFYAYVDGDIRLGSDRVALPFSEGFASFRIDAIMRADFSSAISSIVQPVIGEIDRVYGVVEPLWVSLQDLADGGDPLAVLGQLPAHLRALGVPEDDIPGFVLDMVSTVGDIQTVVDDSVGLLEEFGFEVPDNLPTSSAPLDLIDIALNGFDFPVSFPGADIPFIPAGCITVDLGGTCYSIPPVNALYTTVCAPWPWDDECARIQVTPYFPGTPGVRTPRICPGVVDGDPENCYLFGLVPFDFPGVPGLCDAIPARLLGLNRDFIGSGTAECDIGRLIELSVDPILQEVIAVAIGIEPSQVPPITEALTNLAAIFDSTGGPLFAINCATFSADVASLRESNTVGMGLNFTLLGGQYGFTFGWEFGPNPADAAYKLVEAMLIDVLSGDALTPVLCDGALPGQADPPPFNLALTAPVSTPENTGVTLSGTFASVSAAHSVEITWDDDTTQTIALPAGTLAFASAYHPVDDDPSNTASDHRSAQVTVTNTATDGSVSGSARLRVDNVVPSALTVDVATAINENGSVTVNGSFIDSGVGDSHVIDITWGDRTAPVRITLPADRARAPGTPRTFSATHQYRDDNPTGTPSDVYTIGVSVRDDDTGSTSLQRGVTVNNLTPSFLNAEGLSLVTFSAVDQDGVAIPAAQDGSLVITEGQTIIVDGAFSDIGANDTHEVTIDWGDGDPTVIAIEPGLRTFRAEHRFADDDPTVTPTDTYRIDVSVTDDDMPSSHDDVMALDPLPAYATAQAITVNNVVPYDVVLGFGLLEVDENDVVVLEASFTDPGFADTYVVTIDWGDGSGSEEITIVPQTVVNADGETEYVPVREFAFEHRYLDDDPTDTPVDSYVLAVTLTDDDSGVADQAAMVTTFNQLVLDANGQSTPIILEDGSPGLLTTEQTMPSPIARVADVPAEVEFTVNPQIGGNAHIDENDIVTLAGSFVDPGTLDSFTVDIDWGDGSPKDQILIDATPGRPFDVPIPFGPIDHQYLDDNPTSTRTDSYIVTVTVTDDDTLDGRATQPVIVDNVLPTIDAGSGQFVFEDDLVSLDPATFADIGTADTHTASVTWGDGTAVDVVTVTEYDGPLGAPAGATGVLDADHRYLRPGIYRTTVCITDDDERANPVCDSFEVTVVNAFLKFGLFGNDDRTQVDRGVQVDGGIGGNRDVKLDRDASASGDIVSVEYDVDLRRGATGGAAVVAGRDAALDGQVTVAGNVDVGRRVVSHSSATIGGTTTEGPAAYTFPDVTWATLGTTPGTDDERLRGTSVLAPGDWGTVRLNRGTMSLEAGLYRMEELRADKDTVIQIDLDPDGDNVADPLIIEVQRGLQVSTGVAMEITSAVGDATDILIIVTDGKIRLGKDGTFLGTFIADDNEARIDQGSTLDGALYGTKLRALRNASITANPALQLWADHVVAKFVGDGDDVLLTVDAGPNQRVYEDDQVVLAPATFDDRGATGLHTATINWGDGTVDDGVVTEADGSVAGQHRFTEPGRYVVAVCVFGDPQAPTSCQQDTLVVTVLNGFLRFGVFGDTSSVDVDRSASVDGGVAGNQQVRLHDDSAVTGSVVSIGDDVDLSRGASIIGDVIAGRDTDLGRDAVVDGNVDAGRNVDGDDSAVVTGTITTGPDARVFPAIRWTDIEVVGGASSQNLRGASTLDPGIYGDVRVDDGTLSLRSGTYRLRSLDVKGATEILIDLDPDGDGVARPVLIEVEKDVKLDSATTMSVVSTVGGPADVLVVSGSSITLGQRGTFVGTFIAGDGKAKLDTESTLTGGLYGRTTSVGERATVVRDPALDTHARWALGR